LEKHVGKVSVFLLAVVSLSLLGASGCQMNRAQRTGVGAGAGAAGGAALGAAIGSAFGVPGLGALWEAVGGTVIGAATGALWPDKTEQSESDRQEIERLANEGEMGLDRLSETIKQTNLSPEAQDVYLAHAKQITAEAKRQGKDVKFYIEPGQGMKYRVMDSGSETKTTLKEEPAEATSVSP
jgi:hypothetical protein